MTVMWPWGGRGQSPRSSEDQSLGLFVAAGSKRPDGGQPLTSATCWWDDQRLPRRLRAGAPRRGKARKQFVVLMALRALLSWVKRFCRGGACHRPPPPSHRGPWLRDGLILWDVAVLRGGRRDCLLCRHSSLAGSVRGGRRQERASRYMLGDGRVARRARHLPCLSPQGRGRLEGRAVRPLSLQELFSRGREGTSSSNG